MIALIGHGNYWLLGAGRVSRGRAIMNRITAEETGSAADLPADVSQLMTPMQDFTAPQLEDIRVPVLFSPPAALAVGGHLSVML